MANKDLYARGVSRYTVRQLRELQRDLPEINDLIYETSQQELTPYDLGDFDERDLVVEFEDQNEVLDINQFIRSKIRQARMEAQVAEETGRTLNFIKNDLQDLRRALPDYTDEQLLQMSKQERLAALHQAYYERYGVYTSGSDEAELIRAITA